VNLHAVRLARKCLYSSVCRLAEPGVEFLPSSKQKRNPESRVPQENHLMPSPTVRELAKLIDHSLLHPTMTDAQIADGCRLARRYEVATACVKPYAIAAAKDLLAASSVGATAT